MTNRVKSISLLCWALVMCAATNWAWADSVVMQNGDHYNGKVLSVGTNTLVLQSDVLGTVNLPRAKVASLTFGTNVVSASATAALPTLPPIRLASFPQTNAASANSASLHQLKTQTNLIQQVQGQFLSGASPEVGAKYNQMLGDLSTGKMSIGDLRAQAKDAADQLRSLQRDGGDDSSGAMSMYLTILDQFLQESAGEATTNSATAAPKPSARPVPDEP
jgi:hypothetical protein